MKRNKRFSIAYLAILGIWLYASQSTLAQCPGVDVSQVKTTACADDPIDLTKASPSTGKWWRYSVGDMDGKTTFSQNYSGTADLNYVVDGCTTKVTITISNKVTFYSTPTIPASMCPGSQAISLTAGVPQGVTAVAYIDGKTATSLDPSSLTDGSHEIKWIGTSAGGCKDSVTKSFSVSIPTAPTASDVTLKQTGSYTLTATGSSGNSSFKFFKKDNGSWVETSSQLNLANIAVGVYEYAVTETVNSCESAKAYFKVTIETACDLAAPTVSQSSFSFCSLSDAQITPSGVANADFYWYSSSALTGGQIGSVFHPTAEGTYYVTQKTNCESKATEFSVTLATKPNAPTTQDVTACEGSNYTLTANGTNIEWWLNSSATGNAIATGNNYKPTQAGQYYATQSNGTCKSATVMATLSFSQAPTANLQVDKTSACTGATVTLTVNGNGTWFGTTPSGSGTTYTYSTNNIEEVTFAYIEKQGECSDTAFAKVSFQASATPSLSPSKTTVCTQDIIALNPSPIGGEFSVTGGANVAGSSFSTQTAGDFTITYTTNKGTACEASTQKTITANATPIATVQTDKQDYCSGETVTISTSNNGQLRYPAGLNADGQGKYTYSPTTIGAINIEYIAQNGNCYDTAKTSVTVNSKQIVNLSVQTEACVGDQLSIFASPSGGELSATAGTLNATAKTITGTSAGTIDLSYTVDKGTSCEVKETKSITINAAPKATISVDKTQVCVGEKITITTSNNGSLDQPTNVTSLGSGKYEYTVTSQGTQELVYTSEANGCTDKATTSIQTNGSSEPISFTLQSTACTGEKIALSATPAGGEFTTSSGTIDQANSFSSDVAGQATITYTVGKNSSCETKLSKTIDVSSKATASISLDKSSVCVGTAVTITTSNNGTITQPQGLTGNAGVYQYTAQTAGSYSFTYEAGSGTCKDTKTVNLEVLNAAANVTFDLQTEACTGTNISLSASPAGGTFTSTIGTISENTSLSSVTAGSGKVSYTYGSGNCATVVAKDITFTEKANITFNTESTICVGQKLSLSATPAGGEFSTTIGTINSNNEFSHTSAGEASITYTVNKGSLCEATKSQTISINDKPNISFTVPATACQGQVIALSATPAGGKFYATIGTVTNNSLSCTAIGTEKVRYVLNENTACQASVEQTITVSPLTEITFTPAANFCAGSSLNLSATPSGGEFSSSIGTVSDANVLTSSTPGIAQVSYIIGRNTACESKVTKSVEILYTPSAPIISPSSQNIALGTSSASFTANVNTTNLLSYTWTNSSSETIATQAQLDIQTTSMVLGSYTYSVKAKFTRCESPAATATLTIVSSQLNFDLLNAAIKRASDTLAHAKTGTTAGTYPTAEVTKLNNALQAGKDALITSKTSSEVESAAQTLQAAVDAFIATIIKPLDRSSLQSAISSAQSASSNVVAGTEENQYPQSAIDAIKAAISSAENEYKNENATVASIKSATETLNQAVSDFLAQKISAQADKSMLITKLQELSVPITQYKDSLGLIEGQYSSDAYAKVISAQTKAQDVIKNINASELDVLTAYTTLTQAFELFLKTKVVLDRSSLKSTIVDADVALVTARVNSGIDKGQYPASAIQEFEKSFASANIIFNKTKITQAIIDSTDNALRLAIANIYGAIITNVPVTKIEVLFNTLEMGKGTELPLVYNVYPKNATNKNVRIKIDNADVISILNDQIKGLEYGTCNITITALDGSGISTKMKIEVINPTDSKTNAADKITISPTITNNEITINTPSVLDSKISIVSLNGVVKSVKNNAESTVLSLSELSNGIYTIVIEKDGQVLKSEKIIKQ